MTHHDVHRLPTPDLLRLDAAVHSELVRRGIMRTGNSVGGELGENLACRVYGGELAPPSTPSFDVVGADGRRIQVKARVLSSGVQRFFSFSDLDVDLAVCIRFDRDSLDLAWAREFTQAELRELCTPHTSGELRLSTTRAVARGRDVTSAFRIAVQELDHGAVAPTDQAFRRSSEHPHSPGSK